jgi:hypothetical protein
MNSIKNLVARGAHEDANLPNSVVYEIYKNAFKLLHRLFVGHNRTNVFNKEWDVLVVLDACRLDIMESIADEYNFVRKVDSIESVGSASAEWLEKTFTEEHAEEVAKTSYVTANVKSNSHLQKELLGSVDEVWRYAWDEDIGTVPPRPVTDQAIRMWRTSDHARMVVHYMQPHFPSVTRPDLGSAQERTLDGGAWRTTSVWDDLRMGKRDLDTVWEGYLDNLRAVLDEVKILLESISASTVVLTSDHGNAAGEWGFYDHPGYHPLSVLRVVPWIETSADNQKSYEPNEYERTDEVTDEDVTNRLKDLGYLSE